MNICGVLVHVRPDRVADVALAMRTIPGSELHGQTADGRLIVTVEDTAGARAFDGLTSIHGLPGVVAASLVYHHFEPVPGEPGTVVKEV
ncbi:MAG: chaperone NapD [Alphaproteobacteria bacterium]